MNKKQIPFVWIGTTFIIFFVLVLLFSIQRFQLCDKMMADILKIEPYNSKVFNDIMREKEMASWAALGSAVFIFFISSFVGMGVYLNKHTENSGDA